MSNTITAYFKGRIGVAEAVYQNDYGIVMAFDSIDLPAHFECFFSKLNQEEAVPGLGADRRVAIPNSVLADPGNVTIHIPLHTGEDDSEVEYVVYFKVIGRARPIDDGTPTQMTAIERALALLSQPITNIEEIVNEALSFTGDTFAEMKEELQGDYSEFTSDVNDDIADFKTEIRGDIGDVEHDFDILDGQFQTAVAAITVDSEVQGIRTGDDGVTYTSAGEAVRNQFSDVKSATRDISTPSPINIFRGGFEFGTIDSSGIASGSDTRYIRTTEYIEMPTGTQYINLYCDIPFEILQAYIIEYDSSKNFISESRRQVTIGTNPWNRNIALSDTTKYVKLFFFNSTAFSTYRGIKAQITVGLNFVAYYPQIEAYDVTARKQVADILTLINNTCFKEYSGNQITSSADLASLDDCQNNTIYRINCASTKPANCPFTQGIVFTIGWDSDSVDTMVQFAKTVYGDLLYVRTKWNTTWQPWNAISSARSVKESDLGQITDTSVLTSLNDCQNNIIYRINCTQHTPPENSPTSQGVCFTVGYNLDGTETKMQFFCDLNNNMYTRLNWGSTWTKWTNLKNTSEPIDFGFIEKFAVIGDSYASGEIYVADSSSQTGYTAADYYSKSWGQILARNYGAKCINLSKGGLTTRTWLTDSKGLALMQSSEAQELYLCALGHNDEGNNQYGINYLGALTDITDHTSSADYGDTFYGNYGRIIESIKAKAPNAKIVLMTVAYLYNSVEDSFNNAIIEIANYYGVPYIDIKTDDFYLSTSIYHTGKMWNHPTAPLYAGMAKANARLFAKCVKDNYNYFKNLVG